MRTLIKIIHIFGITAMFAFLILVIVMACYSLYKPIALLTENNKYQWEELAAELQQVDLESFPNPDLPYDAGKVFTLDTCKVRYAYQYGGEYYTNTQIGLNRKKEYNSNFHNELYRQLKDKHKVTAPRSFRL